MIDLLIKQSWLERSSDTAIEEYKSALVDYLNSNLTDRHVDTRWSITKVTEGNVAHLIYDEKSIAILEIKDSYLHLNSDATDVARYDDIIYSVRYIARALGFAVYSNLHQGARLPADPSLVLDHTFFQRNKEFSHFFQGSDFIPRYCEERYEQRDNGGALVIYPPYYAENKHDHSIHLINAPMIEFLVQKEDQTVSKEFSYKVAESMNDFAKKDDFGLIPGDFYKYYEKSIKIINNTSFDINNIDRKVFIDPYVWDFDAEHDNRFYQNVKNGLHYMDKVRKGETLDQALKRLLHEELKVGSDYVGARIWGIEFDRDIEGVLTPRLKLNIYVHGLASKQRSLTHDWVTIK